MGMQISRGVYTEVSEESVVSTVAEGTRNGVSGIGQTAGERSAGGASDGRSCAYAALDTAEAFGFGGDGIRERQKRYSRCTGVCWPEAEFCGPALLGEGLLGIDSGQERSGGASIHPGAGKGRPTFGPTRATGALSASRNH